MRTFTDERDLAEAQFHAQLKLIVITVFASKNIITPTSARSEIARLLAAGTITRKQAAEARAELSQQLTKTSLSGQLRGSGTAIAR